MTKVGKTSPQASKEPIVVGEPFNNPADADFVVRTKDGAEFHVYKVILSLASPFFRDMFSLPQESGASASVDVEEAASTWTLLLRFFYPFSPDPHFDTLDAVALVLAAAAKYQMSRVISRITQALVNHSLAEKEPIQMYALGIRYGMHDVARAAAKWTLQRELSDFVSSVSVRELEHISAASFVRLMDYHRRCGEAASSAALGPRHPDMQGSFAKMCFFNPVKHGVSCVVGPSHYFGSSHYSCRQYLHVYLTRVAEELKKRPSSAVPLMPAMVQPVTQAGSACCVCATAVDADISVFAQLLRDEIDMVIPQIQLKIVADA